MLFYINPTQAHDCNDVLAWTHNAFSLIMQLPAIC